MVFALASIPTVYLVGAGVDYGMAVDHKTQLDAYADAAALAAVTPAMMIQTTSAATTVAQNTFNAQAQTLSNISYSPQSDLTVTVSSSGQVRTVTVTYHARSHNFFPNVLGQTDISLTGTATAKAGQAPNIDFYLMLDSSPSMAIAATQADINKMVANTGNQGGCAFGCHESHPSSDNLGNPGGVDNYQLARNLGVTLRIDMLRQAVQDLVGTAQTTASTYNAAYRMAMYSFDANFNSLGALTASYPTMTANAANLSLLTVYKNNWLTSSNNNSDTDTNYDGAMTGVNQAMPNPGSGTTVAGDKPQEVLFFVTDGVEDERTGGNRQQSVMDPAWCTTIKNRGIRIAVLYTEYLPLPTNAWYNTYISPFQSSIGPTLKSCASPGLYFMVQTGGDISSAMATLFQEAVQTAYLAQ